MKSNFIFKVQERIKVTFDGLTELFGMLLSNASAFQSNISMMLTKYWSMAKTHQLTLKQTIYLKAEKPLNDLKQRIFIEPKVNEQAKKEINDAKESKTVYISNVFDDMTKDAKPDRNSLAFIECLYLLRIVSTALQNHIAFKALSVKLDELKAFGIIKTAHHWYAEVATILAKKLNSCKTKVTIQTNISVTKALKERFSPLFAVKAYPVFIELLHLARLKAHDNKRLCAMDGLTLDELEKIKL